MANKVARNCYFLMPSRDGGRDYQCSLKIEISGLARQTFLKETYVKRTWMQPLLTSSCKNAS